MRFHRRRAENKKLECNSNMERRVVITAEAAITPIGHGKNDILANLIQGKSGIKNLKKEVNYLKRYYHSNLKYIKQLWARMDELEKMIRND